MPLDELFLRVPGELGAPLFSVLPRGIDALSGVAQLLTNLFNLSQTSDFHSMGCAPNALSNPQPCARAAEVLNFLLRAFLDLNLGGTRSTLTVKALCASTGSASLCELRPDVKYQCRRCINL